jgi:4-hydroxybenzoate polyprenyltransferase
MSIETIKQSIRWDSWAQGKVSLLCSIMFYLVGKSSGSEYQAILTFVLFLGFSIISSIYGYLINDLFDIEIDKKHGKRNVFENAGFLRGIIIVIVVFVASVMFGLRFLSKDYFLILWIIWTFSSTFYSARPIRFKERGVIGLLFAFMSQYPIPLLLCFAAFGSFGSVDMWGIIVCTTISGAALEIGHQRFDMEKDHSTNTKTFAVRTGQHKVDKFYKIFLFGDLFSVFGMMLLMAFYTPLFPLKGVMVNIFILPLAIHLILTIIVLFKMFQKTPQLIDPYYVKNRRDILNITFILFPNFFLPFYLSCVLFLQYHPFILFVLLFLCITYINFPKANILWPFRILTNEIMHLRGK